VFALFRKKKQNRGYKMFGVSLVELVGHEANARFKRRQKKAKKKAKRSKPRSAQGELDLVFGVMPEKEVVENVPEILQALTHVLKSLPPKAGLFRENGSVARIKQAIEKLEKGSIRAVRQLEHSFLFSQISRSSLLCAGKSSPLSNLEANDVASLYKKYLRELPVPVIPFDIFEELVEVASYVCLMPASRGEVASAWRLVLLCCPACDSHNQPNTSHRISFLALYI
jgi:hypothetical protein